jgi:hypothetical protein
MPISEAIAAPIISTPTPVSGGLVRQSRRSPDAALSFLAVVCGDECIGCLLYVAIVNISIAHDVDDVNTLR